MLKEDQKPETQQHARELARLAQLWDAQGQIRIGPRPQQCRRGDLDPFTHELAGLDVRVAKLPADALIECVGVEGGEIVLGPSPLLQTRLLSQVFDERTAELLGLGERGHELLPASVQGLLPQLFPRETSVGARTMAGIIDGAMAGWNHQRFSAHQAALAGLLMRELRRSSGAEAALAATLLSHLRGGTDTRSFSGRSEHFTDALETGWTRAPRWDSAPGWGRWPSAIGRVRWHPPEHGLVVAIEPDSMTVGFWPDTLGGRYRLAQGSGQPWRSRIELEIDSYIQERFSVLPPDLSTVDPLDGRR